MAYPAFAQAEAPTEGVGAVVDPGFSKPGWRDAKCWVWSETYYYNIEVWGKVIFLHLCVNLFILGGGFPACITGVCIWGRSGGLPPGGSQVVFIQEWDLLPGGMPTGGFCILGVGRFPPGLPTEGFAYTGGRPPPRDTWNTTGYGQQAGSTHPTGMHSCLQLSETERNWTGGSLYFDIFQRSHIKLRANWLSEKGGRVHIIWLNRNEMPHC